MASKKSTGLTAEKQLKEAVDKIRELLTCDDKRIELSAAKELVALAESGILKTDEKKELEVTIKVI